MVEVLVEEEQQWVGYRPVIRPEDGDVDILHEVVLRSCVLKRIGIPGDPKIVAKEMFDASED